METQHALLKVGKFVGFVLPVGQATEAEVLRYPDLAPVFPVGQAMGAATQSELLNMVQFAELVRLSAGQGSC